MSESLADVVHEAVERAKADEARTERIQTYRVDGSWVASQNEQWIPGIYDSADTARLACSFSDEQLHALAHIWKHDGEDRPATRADLEGIVH